MEKENKFITFSSLKLSTIIEMISYFQLLDSYSHRFLLLNSHKKKIFLTFHLTVQWTKSMTFSKHNDFLF